MTQTIIKYYSADFETTTYEGIQETEVWASAIVELYTEDVKVWNNISSLFNWVFKQGCDCVIYFHNLKFDGTFILYYFLEVLHWEVAYSAEKGFYKFKDMPNRSLTYSISAQGLWYTIRLKYANHKIEIRDSLKLIPFSVKEIGRSFGTKHRKSEIEYELIRHANGYISPQESDYIANDVLVVKEALEIMFDRGYTKLTIGSCCLDYFKSLYDKQDYNMLFPNLWKIAINPERFKQDTAGEFIYSFYRGAFCYVVKGKENRIYKKGLTIDVNSLYPSVMHSSSGNRYPVGQPHLWYGNYIPQEALKDDKYYFVRIRTRFKIKKGYLPCIQIKNNKMYPSNEWLLTSDVEMDGKYYDKYIEQDGHVQEAYVTLNLSMTDYKLVQEHYELINPEIICGAWFDALLGIFDEYIDHFMYEKMNSKGARRTEAKLFLNNLYGKEAASTDSSYKIVRYEDGILKFTNVLENNKKPGYIPCGAAITSYAREFTIRAGQKNFHGIDAPGAIYFDTDSIHADLLPEELEGIAIHDKNLLCWKVESLWDNAKYIRQKTYVEHITHEDMESVEPYWKVTCAGMQPRVKRMLCYSLQGVSPSRDELMEDKPDAHELSFIIKKRTLREVSVGMLVPGRLRLVKIKGGTVLVKTDFKIKERMGRYG